MSLLLFDQTPADITIVTDTIICSVDACSPIGETPKAFHVGGHVMIVGLGLGNLVQEWVDVARRRGLDDIDLLKTRAPNLLRGIHVEMVELWPTYTRSTTLYHFGLDDSGRFRRDVFRSVDNFEPEVSYETGFGIKPVLRRGDDLYLPDGVGDPHPQTQSDYLALAVELRDLQLEVPVDHRVGVGGHLDFHIIDHDGIRYIRGPDIPSVPLDLPPPI